MTKSREAMSTIAQIGGAASRLLDRAMNVSAWIAGALLMFQVVSVTLDVSLRYLFKSPIYGVVAFNEWSLLFVAFLGAAWLQREGGHVRMDVLTGYVERVGGGRFFEAIGLLIGVVCCAVLLVFSIKVVIESVVKDVYDYFKLREVPIWPFYATMAFGSLLWLLQLLRQVYRLLFAHMAGGGGAAPSDL